ncbi:CBS domain-containing protein CBSX6-like [Ananas comosus]|uniref:CBS domain-containing protein CBSX6-like n=1 Tax=Ananas comosus TaxID=4615 RepID=A0A6P5EY14_ANACO|nr:CBS domain-containing protein CBSX6-like [Ananas comosus]
MVLAPPCKRHVSATPVELGQMLLRIIPSSHVGPISPWAPPGGILGALDVVSFLAGAGGAAAASIPVPEAAPDQGVIREVDPGTRSIDATQGVRCLLVRKCSACSGISKRSSDLYSVKWLRNNENSSASSVTDAGPSYSPTPCNNYCCLSQEDVVRFLIGRCLNALAPLPLSPISSLGAINPNYSCIEAFSPAIKAIRKIPPYDTPAVAVVETNPDRSHKPLGHISSYKLQKCDYLATAWAMANLSAGEFVAGSNDANRTTPEFTLGSQIEEFGALASPRLMKFSSRCVGFFSNNVSQIAVSARTDRSVYRGRNATLTCKKTSSLAAVMA